MLLRLKLRLLLGLLRVSYATAATQLLGNRGVRSKESGHLLGRQTGDGLGNLLLRRGRSALLLLRRVTLWCKLWRTRAEGGLRLSGRAEVGRLILRLRLTWATIGAVTDLLREARALRPLLKLLAGMFQKVVVIELS